MAGPDASADAAALWVLPRRVDWTAGGRSGSRDRGPLVGTKAR